MQAPQQAVVAQVQDLVELDLACLAHVGGGTPKGTWLTGETETLSVESEDLEPTPKGTW
jgi:hypothetical protein